MRPQVRARKEVRCKWDVWAAVGRAAHVLRPAPIHGLVEGRPFVSVKYLPGTKPSVSQRKGPLTGDVPTRDPFHCETELTDGASFQGPG